MNRLDRFDAHVTGADTSVQPLMNRAGEVGGLDQGTNWSSLLMGGSDAQGFQTAGILPVGIQAISGIMSGIAGFQANKIAKEKLAFTKEAWRANFRNQVKSYNTNLRDRQNERYRRDPKNNKPVSAYMKQNAL